ncbi:MAG: cupin domain-containing protein [Gammaproteobacteria bacterium]|nr:cupin domain-containing protein [Gammaproteobacteria bacterium]
MPNTKGKSGGKEVETDGTERQGFDVGAHLKAIRKSKGLSQRQLARRSGVSNGTISLIEQDKISPSIASLKQLLDGMQMSIADFFSAQGAAEQKIFFRADELTEHSSSGFSFRLVGTQIGDRQMQIIRERYDPGADTGESMLSHDGEEGGVVVRGQIEITVADQVDILSEGDAYYFKSTLPHRFRNVGDEECEIVSAATPPTF